MTSSWHCTRLMRSVLCIRSSSWHFRGPEHLFCWRNYLHASCDDEPDKIKKNLIYLVWLERKAGTLICRGSHSVGVGLVSSPSINGTVSRQLCYAIWLSEIFISCVKTDPLWSPTQRQCSASLPHINTLYLGSISGRHVLLLRRALNGAV